VSVILLTGADGQLGWELVRTLAPLGEVHACARSRLDVTDADAVRDLVARVKPDVIVNAAAYTAVDRAESECSSAMLVNARAPRLLAEAAEKLGAWLLHYSTDYVFDGSKRGAYREDDAPNPLNAYGRSKLAGEQAIMSAVRRHLIFRTSWLYGNHGGNFLRSMLELGAASDEFGVVADQRGAPTWHRLVAEATAIVLGQLRCAAHPPSVSGIYHLTCSGEANWFDFAQAIFDAYPPSRRPILTPLTSEQYATTARRPLNSLLANEKIRATFGIVMPPWRHALALCASEARALAAPRLGRRASRGAPTVRDAGGEPH